MRKLLGTTAAKVSLPLVLPLVFLLAMGGLAGNASAAGPDSIADHVVISEIHIDGNDDWIELYNPTNQSIDLTAEGYRLDRWTGSGYIDIVVRFGDTGDASYPGGTTIPAYGFYLIVDDDAGDTDLKNKADALITRTFALADNYAVGFGTGPMGGGSADKDTVDLVGWGSSTVSETATISNPVTGGSIERKANGSSTQTSMGPGGSDEFRGNGYDSDDNSQDFVLRDNPQPQNSSSPPEPGPPASVTVAADPTAIVADGVSTAAITATVVDTYTNPVADGTVVTFTTDLGTLGSDTVTKTTTSGVATGTLASGTEAGTATITATADTVSDTTNVTFTAGPPDVVTVTVGSSTISCCVTTTVRVTVTDGYANAVTDTTPVTLSSDLTADISPLTDTTENGLVTATVHGDKAGRGTITATTTGNVAGTRGLTVTHSAPYTLTLARSSTAIVADGTDSAEITATVTDVCGNPVPNATVRFTTTLGSIGSRTATKITNVDGEAAVTLTGAESGLATIIAAVDSISRTTTVDITTPSPVGGTTYALRGGSRLWRSPVAIAVLILAVLMGALVLFGVCDRRGPSQF